MEQGPFILFNAFQKSHGKKIFPKLKSKHKWQSLWSGINIPSEYHPFEEQYTLMLKLAVLDEKIMHEKMMLSLLHNLFPSAIFLQDYQVISGLFPPFEMQQ